MTIGISQPLGALIDKSHKPQGPGIDDEVWSLNLDQIEPHSGHVLVKRISKSSELGPSTHPFARGTVLYSKLRPYLNKVVVADDDGLRQPSWSRFDVTHHGSTPNTWRTFYAARSSCDLRRTPWPVRRCRAW